MNLKLGEFIAMPDHFHAVIIIGDNIYNSGGEAGDAKHRVSKNRFGPQSKNLASIIRGFKSAVTIHALKTGIADFKWQERYHDHIIRNENSFDNIQNYIIRNPRNWKGR